MTETLPLENPALIARPELANTDRDEMFALLSRHFDGVTRPQFERDLAQKDAAIQIRQNGRLVGFSTLRVASTVFEGEPLTVIYSGDTIVEPEAWGSPALARAWISGVSRIRNAARHRRCFWLLLASGFRTYRFLPVFWREFHPCCDRATPAPAQRLLGQLAREGYGSCFDPGSGVVRFAQPQRLRGALAQVPRGREGNPHVAFFLARNPGHARGDELACLTEISDANLSPAGRRIAGKLLE